MPVSTLVTGFVPVGGPRTLLQSIKAERVGGHRALIGELIGSAGDVLTAMHMARRQHCQGLIVEAAVVRWNRSAASTPVTNTR